MVTSKFSSCMTDATIPTISLAIDGVLLVVFMPLRAMGFRCMNRWYCLSMKKIFPASDRLKMFDFTAGPVSTQMI